MTARLEPGVDPVAAGGGGAAVESGRRAEGRDCRFPEMRCVEAAAGTLSASGTSIFSATDDTGLGGMGGTDGGFGRSGAGGTGAASTHTSRRQFQGMLVVACAGGARVAVGSATDVPASFEALLRRRGAASSGIFSSMLESSSLGCVEGTGLTARVEATDDGGWQGRLGSSQWRWFR